MIISRQKNEGIVINDDIIVTVVEIRDDKVRLGVEGPNEMSVHRGEVLQAIRRAAEGAEQAG